MLYMGIPWIADLTYLEIDQNLWEVVEQKSFVASQAPTDTSWLIVTHAVYFSWLPPNEI